VLYLLPHHHSQNLGLYYNTSLHASDNEALLYSFGKGWILIGYFDCLRSRLGKIGDHKLGYFYCDVRAEINT